ncbi:STAS domain-containing protein [Plebeiibacterium marinum]|uniref:STAS domain-containing protein n=1 Tax=Plebeiibacterium marinum TaxID=2992111 RepID=A0AAE3SIA7_9BACT|nr:STAS domain-containing protein [Plebeiobacterium marinum]MCW3804263.1 STAS domain-containing protein [Plebeiobacterium marinum]
MIKIKTYQNTVLVSFDEARNKESIDSVEFKNELIQKLTHPFSNIMVDFAQVNEISAATIDALIAGQRLSEMNKGQVSLFNVKEKVFKMLRSAKVDHLFFFCDIPKPFSSDLLMA